ncbi:MAG: hypothetical protein AAFY76_05670, partial [Cyanobacteria bacterium J06649_11]
HTHCSYLSKHCRPEEKPDSIIVWGNVTHDSKAFKRLGRYKMYLIEDYVLIPTLKIRGAIQREFKKKFFQLDNGLVLMEAKKSYESNEKKKDKDRSKRNVMKTMAAGVMVVEDMNGDTKCSKPYKLTELFDCPTVVLAALEKEQSEKKEFEKIAKEYAEKTKADHLLLLEAHLATTVDLTFNHFRALWHQICRVNQQTKQFRSWADRHFPQAAQSLRSDEPGVIVKSIGDALILYKCQAITSYEIKWDRKYRGRCWLHFPVWLPHRNTTKFLRIEDRNLLQSTQKINCTKRPRHTVVDIKNGPSYHVDHKGKIEKLRGTRSRVKFDTMLKPPREFNTKIRFENEKVWILLVCCRWLLGLNM